MSASHLQLSWSSASPGPHFGNAALPGFKAFVNGVDFILFLWSGSQGTLLGDPVPAVVRRFMLVLVISGGGRSWDSAVRQKQPLSGWG